MARKAAKSEKALEQPLLAIAVPRRQQDRIGKKTIATHLDPAVGRAVAILAAKEGRTRASLLAEAIEDLLTKYQQDVNER